MPGTGPLRRSSGPARKKAIVGKSRVEPDRHQRPAFVFLALVGGRRKRKSVSGQFSRLTVKFCFKRSPE
jgi:hypothetical protein